MIQCQKCGQINAAGSNFCRTCGNSFAAMTNGAANNYDYSPRQPYSWKTDEFQPVKPDAARQVEPLNNSKPAAPQAPPRPTQFAAPPNFGAPLGFQQSYAPVQSYRCPRCASQYLPIVERKISSAGWIVFAALLVIFFPLFWVGFLIKEDVRTCPTCRMRVG
jgi:hypothetical protein